ncbi:hypothetical protein [Streptomyces sp. NPDC102487]|uniref:hypothetical protein n=1 Tax=Streptomyces sp. NPDC102487 TaxID=3366182 RepID=UPI003809AACC
MDTLAPTEPVTDQPQPPAAPAAEEPQGPPCVMCGKPALVHWMRRPTDEELVAIQRLEQDRRDHALQLADPQLPNPVFPPMPQGADTTVAVYACGPHAIGMEDAALIHSSACTAPNEADLPGHDCIPEKLPTEPPEKPGPLPAHWTSGGQ